MPNTQVSGLIVLNPQGVPAAQAAGRHAGLAPRLSALPGRVLGIVDDGLAGVEPYLRGVGHLLVAAHSGLEIRYWCKPSLSRASPPILIEEVARTCDGVVVGICG
jgi:hypothetical protein